MESSAEKITHYRELRGVTQEEIALALHVTQGSVSQWELGRTSPSRGNAAKLDKFLGAGGEIVAAYGYKMPADANQPDPTNADLAAALSDLQAVVEMRLPATDPTNGKLLDVLAVMRAGIEALHVTNKANAEVTIELARQAAESARRADESGAMNTEILRRFAAQREIELPPTLAGTPRPKPTSGRSRRSTGRTPSRP